ncbi:MAG: nucleotidyltransferase domain-containing protein [Thermofilum sp.]
MSTRSDGQALLEAAMRVAEEISSAFVGKRGVVGIVYLGGLARGYFDVHSDVDIVVYKRRGARIGWPREKEYEYGGFAIDLEVRDYERDLYRRWSFEERWVFLHALVRYDPQGLVRRLFELKVPLSESERRRLLEEELAKARWSLSDVDAWLHRGDPLSAHFVAITSLKHFLRALAVYNGIPPPPDKWLLHAVSSLEEKPPQLIQLAQDVLVAPSLAELERKKAALRELESWLLAHSSSQPSRSSSPSQSSSEVQAASHS